MTAATAAFRAVHFGPYDAHVERRADGSLLLRPRHALGEYPKAVTDRLLHWARVKPDATFLARRGADGAWVRLSYGQALARARRVGQALLDRGLSAERPLVILSGNDLEHAVLALAALHVGVPYAPISPAYSLLSQDFERVRHAVELLTPGLVYASDGGAYARAIHAAVPSSVEVVLGKGELARTVTPFEALAATEATRSVDEAHAAVGADSIAKFLFTSGSTRAPKAVVNTHRMLCSNQQMFAQCFPFLNEEPPVIVDWLPWHHTFGGNHNFGLVLHHGGTLYIDDGKPTPQGVAETVRNLREVSPTLHFTVPRGLEALVQALPGDPVLRQTFFSRLRLLYPAGAALSADVRLRFDELAVATCGYRIPMSMGLGMTETAPFALSAHVPQWQAGVIGLPVPGLELKLAPRDEKLEVRYKGPSVTSGYWRQPSLSAEAFDDEGYFMSGDAARFIDDHEPSLGLRFDGRIAEDFKLDSGTWVNVGDIRARIIEAGSPYVQDVVVAGHDRHGVGLLLLLQPAHAAALSDRLGADATLAEVASDEQVLAEVRRMLARFNQHATGTSGRIIAATLLRDLPSMSLGECTDKGSLNQRVMLMQRRELVDRMFEAAGPDVLVAF